MTTHYLTAEQKSALKATADALSAPGKGFLASDESAGPWLRAGHEEAAKITDTAENRAAYRSMLYKTEGISEYISGVILHWETLFQKDANGDQMVDLITKNGMLAGIKVDKGYDKAGLPGTATGPLGHAETWCKGIDDLEKRCAEAYAQGARFAKWRNVLQIDPAKGIPSDLAIEMCVQNLAQYAAICQRQGLCPIVEPEIVPNGDKMVDLINKNGMIPGIKLDKGYDKSGLPGTATGPLGHAETWDKGIDDLEKRCAEAYAQGARFAKWRNVLQIDPAKGIPSELAIDVAVKNLAHYAVICQRNGLVPIVEPEIVPNGTHSIEVCAEVTERVLVAQFAALKLYGCYLEGAVLKPNMVKNGLEGPKATPEQVATATIGVLKRTVPPAMPGIFFLSGETRLDEDNEETATINLNTMNKLFKGLPWSASFSYGKALQKTCIVTWMGKNDGPAQIALKNRCKANSDATKGTYVAGTCASVGVDGNVQMAGGAY